MPCPAVRLAHLLLASALLSLASGCDWGNRSLTFNRSFLETDQAVHTVLKHEPTETKDGFAQYGSEKSQANDAIVSENRTFIFPDYQDTLVRVEQKKPGETKVSVKHRHNTWFLISDRDRMPEIEKMLLHKIGQELGEPTPYDKDVEVLALQRKKRVEKLLDMSPKALKDHLDEIPGLGADGFPLIPAVVHVIDLYPQEPPLKARAALTVRMLAGSATASDQLVAEAMPLTTAGRGIAKLPLEDAKNTVAKLVSGDYASHAVALLATAQNPELSAACKSWVENSLNKLGPEFIRKVNEALAKEGNAAGTPEKPKAEAKTSRQE